MTSCYLEINKNGDYEVYSIRQAFNFTLHLSVENKMHDAESFINKS